jgi:hypothetical protein
VELGYYYFPVGEGDSAGGGGGPGACHSGADPIAAMLDGLPG